MTGETELLACPSCGQSSLANKVYRDSTLDGALFRVRCVCGMETRYFPSQAEADALWNTRPTPALPEERVKVVCGYCRVERSDEKAMRLHVIAAHDNGGYPVSDEERQEARQEETRIAAEWVAAYAAATALPDVDCKYCGRPGYEHGGAYPYSCPGEDTPKPGSTYAPPAPIVSLPDEEAVERAARAIATEGFGRPWDGLREALEGLVKLRQGIETDVSSAHSGRGNGASDWMREDDRDFRKDLREAFDQAEAALRASPNGKTEEGR